MRMVGRIHWRWAICFWLLHVAIAIDLASSEPFCIGEPAIRFDRLKGIKADEGQRRVILQHGNQTVYPLDGREIVLICLSSSPVTWDYDAVQVSPTKVQISRKAVENSTCSLYSATLILKAHFNGVHDFASGKYSCIARKLSYNKSADNNSTAMDSVFLYNVASNTVLAQPLDTKKRVIYSGEKQLIIPCIANSPDVVPQLDHKRTEESTLNKTYKYVPGVGFEINGVTSSIVNRTFTCIHLEERIHFQVISKSNEEGDNDLKISAKTNGSCTTFNCEAAYGDNEIEMAFIPCSNIIECGLMRKYLEWEVDFNADWKYSDESCWTNSEKNSAVNPRSLRKRTSYTDSKEDMYVPNGVFACRVKTNRRNYNFTVFSHPNFTEALHDFDLPSEDYIRERNPSNYIVGAVEARNQGRTPYYVGDEEGITVVCIASKFRYPAAPQWFVELANGTLMEPDGEETLDNGNYVTKVTKTFIPTRPDVKNLVCRVARWDSGGWDNLSYPVTIRVPSKPEILNATASNLTVVENSGDVTIFCQFSGSPRPEFFLMKDGEILDQLFLDFERTLVSATYSTTPSTGNDLSKDISGLFECNAENLAGKVRHVMNITLVRKPRIVSATASTLTVSEHEGNVTIFCQFSGDPTEELHLLKDGKEVDRPFYDSKLAKISKTYSIIPSATTGQIKDITGVFECHARNLAGKVRHVMNVTFVHNLVPPNSILIPVLTAVTGATALLLVVFLIARYSSKFSGLKSKNLATNDVQEVRETTNTDMAKIGPSGALIPYGDKDMARRIFTDRANCYAYAEIGSRSLDSLDIRSSTDDISLIDIPLFSPDDLSFDEKLTILGEGNFGVVYKGYLRGRAVAVKSVKHGTKWLKALKSELKIFSVVGYHENLVSLVGVVQQGKSFHADVTELQILIEYCENGDLRSFLRSNRGRFCDLIENDQIFDPSVMISPSSGSNNCLSPYTKLSVVVTTVDLIYWAIQCAAGMEYLASEKVVHGDLALRNLLLTSDRVLKVSDFGLSKKLEGKEYYVFRNPKLTRLPWASTAPELFDEPKPSSRTDVWSYGVAMWEMFSLAQSPYRDRFSEGNTQFVQALVDGYRLGMPKHATSSIYEIMLSCWTLDASKRPSFRQLQEAFHRQVPIGVYPSSGSETDLCDSTASPGSTGLEDCEEEEFIVECEWNPEYLLGSTLKLNYSGVHTDAPRPDCSA